jgi:hypothetical protein
LLIKRAESTGGGLDNSELRSARRSNAGPPISDRGGFVTISLCPADAQPRRKTAVNDFTTHFMLQVWRPRALCDNFVTKTALGNPRQTHI